jgi:predicted DNA-binding WGR domain protein
MFLRFERDTRYYLLEIERNFLGCWSLIRRWGGINTRNGSEMKHIFFSYEEALKGFEELVKERMNKRYEVVT